MLIHFLEFIIEGKDELKSSIMVKMKNEMIIQRSRTLVLEQS